MFEEIIKQIRFLYKTDGFIPLHAPIFCGNEKKYLNECIDTTFVSSVGKFVDQFEIKIAEFTGAKRAVACVNGTNALHLALMLVGVDNNSEVLTQSLTFIATANAIAYCDAAPVFIDVDKDTLGMSPQSLLSFLESETKQVYDAKLKKNFCVNKSSNKKITACVPMHTFGHPCKIDEIIEICKIHNIIVVEDAAESLGSFYKNKHTGTFGKIGILSFNGNKTITTGGGGMLLFNDIDLADKAKHLTTQAKIAHQWEFIHDEIGYNYRMPNINAAIGLAQLEQLPLFLKQKRKLAENYKEFFNNSDVLFVKEPVNSKSNYWLNSILFDNKIKRDEFLKYSNDNKVMTRPAWRVMTELKMFQNFQKTDLSNSYYIADRLVNLPSSVIL